MPRTSRHQIELSAEERAELERRAATVTLPWRVVQRARIVLYAAEGMQDIDIAARLDCSPDSVARRRRRFCAERLDGLEDQARSGRPRRFPPTRGRRGQGDRVRAAGQSRSAAVALLAR
ncbi:MAG: helix-turn-helix domain-containing protein [Actinobacteria bacterium]|nr:helix-turn-helix domain-containing protein [Actinomycetota bacterium]